MATARLALATLLLTGCPAEQLGVPLPPRGVVAINQEDLQRDMFHLLEPGSNTRSPEARAWLAKRFGQMHLEPVEPRIEDSVCGLRRGSEDSILTIASFTSTEGARMAALPDAQLITLAKSIDGLGTPTHGILFCSASGPEATGFTTDLFNLFPTLHGLVHLSELGGERLVIDEPGIMKLTTWDAHSGHERLEPEHDGMEAVDYVRVAEHLRAVHQRFLAPEFTPPDPPRAAP
jgi:hypothetical protein